MMFPVNLPLEWDQKSNENISTPYDRTFPIIFGKLQLLDSIFIDPKFKPKFGHQIIYIKKYYNILINADNRMGIKC